MAQQAQDTFVAMLKDGSNLRVAKGEVLPDGHEVVALDKSGVLFKPLAASYDESPKSARRAVPAAAAVPKAG